MPGDEREDECVAISSVSDRQPLKREQPVEVLSGRDGNVVELERLVARQPRRDSAATQSARRLQPRPCVGPPLEGEAHADVVEQAPSDARQFVQWRIRPERRSHHLGRTDAGALQQGWAADRAGCEHNALRFDGRRALRATHHERMRATARPSDPIDLSVGEHAQVRACARRVEVRSGSVDAPTADGVARHRAVAGGGVRSRWVDLAQPRPSACLCIRGQVR